jgi:hypothetical protein
VDGEAVGSASEVYAKVAAKPPGTLFRYRLRGPSGQREVALPSQFFTVRDWMLLFGAFLLNGAAYVTVGLVVWVLRPGSPMARAFLVVGTSWALFMLTAMDLYRPATFFRLHVVGETLVPPAVLQITLLFPQPHRHARWRSLGYAPSLVILVLYELFLPPRCLPAFVKVNMGYLGLASQCLASPVRNTGG